MRWVAAFAALVVIVPPSAAGTTGARSVTIRVVATATDSGAIRDRDPRGVPNKGDVFWTQATLRNAEPQSNKPRGAAVGLQVTNTRTVSAPPSVRDVTFVATLPGGFVRGGGRVRGAASDTVPVTGGTGDFNDAQGVLQSTRLGGSRGLLLVFRLRLP
jgi:hypothetical protein